MIYQSGKAAKVLPDDEVPEILKECAKRIGSQFFSVDVIESKDGTKRIVEIADGQLFYSTLGGVTGKRINYLSPTKHVKPLPLSTLGQYIPVQSLGHHHQKFR